MNNLTQNKFISIFTERMIPSYIKATNPLFVSFVRYYLEYLEQSNGIYNIISKYDQFYDIEEILSISDTTLKETILNIVSLQYTTSSKENNVISQYLTGDNEEFYYRFNSYLNSIKGTKTYVEFMIKLVIGYDKYFKIY